MHPYDGYDSYPSGTMSITTINQRMIVIDAEDRSMAPVLCYDPKHVFLGESDECETDLAKYFRC